MLGYHVREDELGDPECGEAIYLDYACELWGWGGEEWYRDAVGLADVVDEDGDLFRVEVRGQRVIVRGLGG